MFKHFKASFAALITIAFITLVFGQSFFGNLPAASAQTGNVTPTPTVGTAPTPPPNSVNPHTDTTKCLNCHSEPTMTGTFPDGQTISLYYDPNAHQKGHMPSCVACHEPERTYPHENSRSASCSVCHWQETGNPTTRNYTFTLYYPDSRSLSLEISKSCKKCHKTTFTESADSIHLKILGKGNRYAPVCVDCHNSHDIVPNTLTRQSAPIICSKCHFSTYTAYMSSVHGATPGEDSNQDLPTCEDCHGVHEVHGPSESNFRANSVEVCGKCHSDADRMKKYGLSTNVFQTYLDDFHGRTVDFDRKSNVSYIPEATCYDCHGIHNVRSPKDATSSVYPANLQKTCQQCHVDADMSFPQAWLGHSMPDKEKTPVLFAVNSFYQASIPVVMTSFVLYILLDAQRRVIDHFKKRKSKWKF